MNNPVTLNQSAFYSEDRISSSKIDRELFVTTDSMVPDKNGITIPSIQPKGSLIAFAEGDILVGNIRPYLKKIWYADRKGGCSPDVLVLKAKPGVDSKFLYYSLFRDDFFSHMMKGSKGTKMPRGDKSQIMRFHIPEFDYTNQQRISSVLYALDAKANLNKKIISEIDSMAKVIYDYWFLQFDFPDRDGKPYRTNGGKMKWDDKLKMNIPVNWSVSKLADLIDIDKSGDWGKEFPEGSFTKKVFCFRGADINGLNGLDKLSPPIRYISDKNSFKILKSHDLIIEISGGSPTQSTGRSAFITDSTIKRFKYPLICSNFCKPVSMKNKKLLYNFVYNWSTLFDSGVFFGFEGKTSGIKNLLFDTAVNSCFMVVPDDETLNAFYPIMDSIQEMKQTALAENHKLGEIRDWLLPLLMNKQIKLEG